jgi:hypothetical protein
VDVDIDNFKITHHFLLSGVPLHHPFRDDEYFSCQAKRF